MALFIVTCEHKPEECDDLTREMESVGVAEALKGQRFFCSCPYGHHGGWATIEADSAEACRATFPPVFASHAAVYEVEALDL